MNREQVQQLQHGIYVIEWMDGLLSVAAIGSNRNGDRWIHCSSWVSPESYSQNVWAVVKSATIVALCDGGTRGVRHLYQCPCLIADSPCKPDCSCRHPASSAGCACCAS